MTASKPTTQPRWADSPPSPPPTTSVEPSEYEKGRGFQPGSQPQIWDLQVVTATNGHTYSVTYTPPGGGSSNVSVTWGGSTGDVAGLAAALKVEFDSNADIGTVTDLGSGLLRLTGPAGVAWTVTDPADPKLALIATQAPTTGKPIRQYMNWLFLTIYQWIRWLVFVAFDWGDLGPDWDPPGATLPITTVGTLVGTSGAAVAWLGGKRTSGAVEAHTYVANSDTYLDLGPDGTWHYTGVSNGAGAPAVVSGCYRKFKVVTDGSKVASVADLGVNQARISTKLRLGQVTEGYGIATSSPWRDGVYDSSDEFTLIEEVLPSSGSYAGSRIYKSKRGSDAHAFNCYWVQGTGWKPDHQALLLAHVKEITKDGEERNWVKALLSSDPWQHTLDGDQALSPVGWDLDAVTLPGTQNVGGAMRSTLGDALSARRMIQRVAAATSVHTLMDHFLGAAGGHPSIAVYTGANGSTGGEHLQGHSWILAYNAIKNASGTWTQQAAGISLKLEFGGGGLRLLRFYSGSATSVTDEIASGKWEVALDIPDLDPDLYLSIPGCEAIPDGYNASNGPAIGADPLDARGSWTWGNAQTGQAWWPIRLPDGALIEAATVRVDCPTGSNGQLRLALVRRSVVDSDAAPTLSFKNSPGYDVAGTAAAGSVVQVDLTFDASVADRTVNNAAYSYGFWASKLATNHGASIWSLLLRYRAPRKLT